MNPARWWDAVLERPRHEIALKMTLLWLLIYGHETWLYLVPVKILCILMLLVPGWHGKRGLWAAISALLVYQHAVLWFELDNHKYLLTYWSIACFLALGRPGSERLLALNARRLIGFVFLIATVRKLIMGEYLDGAFMKYLLLFTEKMQALGSAVSGVEYADLGLNQQLLALMTVFPDAGLSLDLISGRGIDATALALGWGTLAIEGAVALAFLLPSWGWLHAQRDLLLIVFAVGTYALLPVLGFAFLLIAMGLAQCEPQNREMRRWYWWALVIVHIPALPSAAELLGRV